MTKTARGCAESREMTRLVRGRQSIDGTHDYDPEGEALLDEFLELLAES